MAQPLPANAHVSTHPCVRAKLAQLRSQATQSRDAKRLTHEIATIVGVEALGSVLSTEESGTDKSPLGYTYPTTTLTPTSISLVPILRSGLSMVDAILSLLPDPIPIHHLGLYREKSTLQPVEYYNNLPYHRSSTSTESPGPSKLAIIVDPVIATGATAEAAVETLKDWGVERVVVLGILGCREGVRRVSEAWGGEDGRMRVEVWVGGLDEGVDERGMIRPGLGDIGDRLFLTMGK